MNESSMLVSNINDSKTRIRNSVAKNHANLLERGSSWDICISNKLDYVFVLNFSES